MARSNLLVLLRLRLLPLLPLLLLLLKGAGAAFVGWPAAGPAAPASSASRLNRAMATTSEAGAPAHDYDTHKPPLVLVVVIGDRTTRLFKDLHEPNSMAILHAEDQRHLERHGGRGRPRHKVGMPGHFGEPQPKAGGSDYPDLVSAYFRRLEKEMEAADSTLIIGHGKGKGQAAKALLKDLARSKPQVAAKVKGLVRMDDTHLTARQVLVLARQVLLGKPDPRKRRVIHGQPLLP